ncbi:DUF5693 family protein [Kamptonema cortianum]|nr:DUF5693 family protein [Geitlerinema splendidum]MDK3161045.1 DUF5693 family protein [Kamptonema cortianum]
MKSNFPGWIWASLIATTVFSLVNVWSRHLVEFENRAVGLVVEMGAAKDLGPAEGLSIAETLEKLKSRSVTTIALNERTFGDLIAGGVLSVSPSPSHRRGGPQEFLVSGPVIWMDRLAEVYEAKFGQELPRTTMSGARPQSLAYVEDPFTLRTLPLGLDPDEVAAVRAAGLELAGRFSNPVGANAEYVQLTLNKFKNDGGKFYIPLGDQVLGDRKIIDIAVEAIKEFDLVYVSAEFVKTNGESKLMAAIPDRVVRLHAAQSAELQRMTPSAITERFSKAARERNVRLLLIRPSTSASEKPLESFLTMIDGIHAGIASDGGGVKPAKPFRAPKTNSIISLLIGVSMAPIFFWCAFSILPNSAWRTAASVLAGSVGLLAGTDSFKDLAALAGAIAFPVLAYLWFLSENSSKPRLLIFNYVGISGITLVGGLQVAALLTGLDYMIQLQSFTGVKLAVFLPIFIALFVVLRSVRNLGEVGREPITWLNMGLTIVALGALAFMAARTGNDNPAGVSGLELQFRDLLDRLLFTRPRTKEFLIGHPLLVIGLGLWSLRQRDSRIALVAALLLGAGAIGQTSVVNTLCHTHTPVFLSLVRILTGHVAGCILGYLGWLLVRGLLNRRPVEKT